MSFNKSDSISISVKDDDVLLLFVQEGLVTSFDIKLRLGGNMAANDSLVTNMKVPELHNFLKERDIKISLIGKSRGGEEMLELCKNVAI